MQSTTDAPTPAASTEPTTTATPHTQTPQDLSPEQLAAVAHMIHNQSSTATNSYSHHHAATGFEKSTTPHDIASLRRRQQLEAQDTWMHTNIHTNNIVSDQEKSMLQHMLDTIMQADNDTTIEIAQSGLRSWQQAQDATSDDERHYHLKKFRDYHRTIDYTTPSHSIAQQALPIRYSDIDDALEDYKAAIQIHRDAIHHDAPTNNSQSGNNDAHFDRLQKRAQALIETKLQFNTQNLPYHTYDISPQARGFMMANNMNYAAFDGAHVTNFQHCLTQEILGIVESSADIASKYDSKSIINQLATHNCNLAISAQQLGQASYIKEALTWVDLCHFFNTYTKLLVDSGLHSQVTMDVSLGIVDGTLHALQKWGTFLHQLGCQPQQTIGKITSDCKTFGTFLCNIVGQACEFMPQAYLNDMNQSLLDNFHAITTLNEANATVHQQTSSRMMQRTQRNAQYLQDGLFGALHNAQEVVENMMEKSLRQNVAYGTEILVDNMITAKATDCLIKIATCMGNQVLQAADKLSNNIPSHLHDATPIFATNAGEIIATTEAGECIGAAVAEQVIKNAARANAFHAQVTQQGSGGNGGDNKQKSTPAQTYTYEHGKYNKDSYHTTKGSKTKSPAPKDGQAALDRSLLVDGSRERVTTENGKIVILKYESEGVYHGYTVEDFFSIKNTNTQKFLVKNGLVNSMKDGKIIK